jgi:hypothetical protein
VSIYGSGLVEFDADNHAFSEEDHSWRGKRCARWKRCKSTDPWDLATTSNRHYRLDPDVVCTCRCGPLVYQGSHVLPSDDDPRGGDVDLSIIPGFIERSPDRPPLSDWDQPYHPWLRLSVTDHAEDGRMVTVVLDRWQVERMRDGLNFWLENTNG